MHLQLERIAFHWMSKSIQHGKTSGHNRTLYALFHSGRTKTLQNNKNTHAHQANQLKARLRCLFKSLSLVCCTWFAISTFSRRPRCLTMLAYTTRERRKPENLTCRRSVRGRLHINLANSNETVRMENATVSDDATRLTDSAPACYADGWRSISSVQRRPFVECRSVSFERRASA